MDFYNIEGSILRLLVTLSCLALCSLNVSEATTEDIITAQVVARMHDYMNATANPCENFYEYSCGNWIKSHTHVINDAANNLDTIYNNKIQNLLEGIDKIEYNNSDIIMARLRTYYESCKQQQSFNVSPYMDILTHMDNEVWPHASESWQLKTKWNMWLTLGRLAGAGLKDLFFFVTWNKDNFTSHQFVVKECNYKSIGAVTVNQFVNMNTNIKVFLEQLNALCEKHVKKDFKQLTVSELQAKVPNIDFLSYFSGLLGDDDILLNSISVTVENLPYYQDLGDLVKRTSQNTIIQTIKLVLGKYLEDNLPKDCVTSMRKVLPLALNYIYEKYEYQQQKKATDEVVQRIFTNLQNKFIEILKQHSNEFSIAERTFLNEKILRMKLNIGNLQLTTDDEEFYQNYYHKWLVVKDNFYENHLNALRHKTLEDSFSKTTFENIIPAFYPFYLFSKNILVVPFQYLAYPEFQPQLHELLLHADLGYSMAHAMMYGFSAFGLQYDDAGRRNISFAQCLLKKPFLSEALNCLNASNSIEVDIKMTDFIGFRLAYDTYFQQPVVPKQKPETDLTDKQLFYLQFAQSECTVRRLPTYIELSLAIQNIVANSPDFEEVFECVPEKGVAATKKCQMW